MPLHCSQKPKVIMGAIALCLIYSAMLTEPTYAQENNITIGYSWQDDTENTLFENHYGLDDGVFLDALHINLHETLTSFDKFSINMSGFGAEPFQSTRLDMRRNGWSLKLDYNRRTYEFANPSFESGSLREDWALSKLNGNLRYNGFKKIQLNLIARHTQRKGWTVNPFLGLGVPYVKGRTFDDRMAEYGLSLSTKAMPIWLMLEQTFTRYNRESRYDVENDGNAILPNDSTLAAVGTPSEDSFTTPTTRMMAAFTGKRIQWQLQGLVRQDTLKTERDDFSLFELSGGSIEQRHRINGDGDRDTTMANARLGIAASESFVIRLGAEYRDRSFLSNITGEELVILTGPLTSETLSADVIDLGIVDQEDSNGDIGFTWKAKQTRLNVSYRQEERRVNWQPNLEAARLDVTRETDGLRATINHRFEHVRVEAGWENDSFSKFIYRTDPEAVDRYWLRLKAKPSKSLSFSLYGSEETADNPAEQSKLDRNLTQFGGHATLHAANGTMVQLGAQFIDHTSDIETVVHAPNEQTIVSNYDSQWRMYSLNLVVPFTDKLRLDVNGSFNEDAGESFPLTSWNGSLRLNFRGPAKMDYGLLAQHHNYDPEFDEINEYDINRYSFLIGRRF